MISVMLVVYNGERYIRTAIESVINQTHKDFELLIVDDGSIDNTLSIIKEYAEKDMRIKFEAHKNNRGVAAARNTALEMAKGEWLTFIDADDAYHPQRLESLLKIALKQEGVFLADDYILCFDSKQGLIPWKDRKFSGIKINFINDIKIIDFTTYLKINTPSIKPFIPLEVISKNSIRYTENCSYGEDLEFIIQIFKKGLKLKLIAHPYYYYRMTPESLTTKIENFDHLIGVYNRTLESYCLSLEEKNLLQARLAKVTSAKEYSLFISVLKSKRILEFIKIAICKPNLMFIFTKNLPKSFYYRISAMFKGGKIKT